MNIQNLMAQAQKIKKEIEKKQEEINNMTFEGKSEAVSIVLNGKKEVIAINIDKTIITSPEDFEILEDMITIAFNNALSAITKVSEEKLGMYGQGLNGMF